MNDLCNNSKPKVAIESGLQGSFKIISDQLDNQVTRLSRIIRICGGASNFEQSPKLSTPPLLTEDIVNNSISQNFERILGMLGDVEVEIDVIEEILGMHHDEPTECKSC